MEDARTILDRCDKAHEEIRESILTIRENHLAHMQMDMNDISLNVKSVSTDVDWLKRFFWIIAAASIGSLGTAIIGLIIKK